ncbi:hypothetical protein RFI_23059, partial [Reticulomyxa filosa]
SSNVICSGSKDNTIRFWDIRTNKNQLHVIKGDKKEDYGIYCLKLLQFKKKSKNNNGDEAVKVVRISNIKMLFARIKIINAKVDLFKRNNTGNIKNKMFNERK